MIRKFLHRLHAFVDLRQERRWCEAHRDRCPAAGGGYFSYSKLHHAWLCKEALAKIAKRI